MVGINITGQIQTYPNIPKFWNNTINYDKLDSSIHYTDGWRDVIYPSYDIETEKLDGLYLVVVTGGSDYYTYYVVAKTQEEIDEYNENQFQNSDEAIAERQFAEDGEALYNRIRYEIRQLKTNGDLTTQQFQTVRTILRPEVLPLLTGDWDIVKSNLDALVLPGGAPAIYGFILNQIKTRVDDYVLNTYDV